MRNIWTIAKREYKYYLSTPIAYLIAGLILFALGVLFALLLVESLQPGSTYVPQVEVFISWLYFPLLFFSLPALTMRLLSAEQRDGTIEMLMTAPVRDYEIVVGKWLGAFLLMLSILAVTWVYPIIINQMVSPGIDQGPLLSGYLGLLLVASAAIAMGVGISSFFSNQIATFFVTIVAFLMFYFFFSFGFADPTNTSAFAQVMRYLDFGGHFQDTMMRGIIDLADVVFFVSFTALWLVVGAVSLETRRWR
ncbi:MAG: ABC transporter permease subunit [Anaerolineales bacterium]|nr:ABC transporter permease subunit [Anaerolineales bacterium]